MPAIIPWRQAAYDSVNNLETAVNVIKVADGINTVTDAVTDATADEKSKYLDSLSAGIGATTALLSSLEPLVRTTPGAALILSGSHLAVLASLANVLQHGLEGDLEAKHVVAALENIAGFLTAASEIAMKIPAPQAKALAVALGLVSLALNNPDKIGLVFTDEFNAEINDTVQKLDKAINNFVDDFISDLQKDLNSIISAFKSSGGAAPLAPTVIPLVLPPPSAGGGLIDVSDGRPYDAATGTYPTEPLAEYYNNSGEFYGGGGDDYIVGDGGPNTFYGNADNDELHGGGGDDFLHGGLGNDWVFGEAGNDALVGYDGVNVLDGGDGDDGLIGGAFVDVMYGQGGNDVLISFNGGFATMYGGEGDDILSADDKDDFLDGGAGADYLFGGGGHDTLYGGDGDDFISGTGTQDTEVALENDYIEGGLGNDTILAFGGDDYVSGGDGHDVIVGGQGRDVIYGGDGDDVVFGGYINYAFEVYTLYVDYNVPSAVSGFFSYTEVPTRNLLVADHYMESFPFAGAFSYDYIHVTEIDPVVDNKYVSGEAGNDIIFGAGGHDTLDGGEGDDALYGQAGDDGLFGGNGNDTLYGGAGDDVLVGGAGRDVLFGGGGSDFIFGGTENDLIRGGEGDDFLYGAEGDDAIVGGDGNDNVEGGIGNDWLEGGIGDDTILAGDGADIILAGEGADNVFGGDGAEIILGGEGEDVLFGEAGDDQLEGGAGTDIIRGGDGDDFIFGDEGADKLYGDAGSDEVQGGDGDDTIEGGDGIDYLFGDQGNDSISGGADNDVLVGDSGDDTLNGDEGDDELYGSEGADYLDGGAGDDTLYGGVGNDVLIGGVGADGLSGEEGRDTYKYSDAGGHVVISDTSGVDTLEFAEGATPTGYSADASGSVVTFLFDSGGSVRFNRHEVELVRFASGTMHSIEGWEAGIGETSAGFIGDDDLIGTERNDYLDGDAGNDRLSGSGGDDRLFGGFGNDVISGGTGYDELAGGQGDDSYLFELGGGQDVIFNYVPASSSHAGGGAQDVIMLNGGYSSDQYVGLDLQGYSGVRVDYVYDTGSGYQAVVESDNLVLGAGINPADVEFEQEGDDLLLSVVDAVDQIRIKNWFLGNAYQLDGIEFANGRTLTPDDVRAVLSLGGLLPENSAPMAIEPLSAQLLFTGETSQFWLPPLAFLDTDIGDKLSYSATLADGSTLPTWLTFDDDPLSFSLTPATDDEGVYEISITATDLEGYSSSSSFNLFITPLNREIVGTDQYDFLNGGIGADTITGLAGNDWLWGYEGADTLLGGDGNDYLVGGAYDNGELGQHALYWTASSGYPADGGDALYGEAGHDLLLGGTGNDYLDGGTGNDNLAGGYGSDTYRFERGYGVDVVMDHAYAPGSLSSIRAATIGNVDVLSFGPGISPADLNVILEYDYSWWSGELEISAMSIGVEGSADRVIIDNRDFLDGLIEQFVFDGGDVLSLEDVVALGHPGTVIFSGSGLYPLEYQPAVSLNKPLFMQAAIAGESFSLQLLSDQFVSNSGSPLEYEVSTLGAPFPSWLSFDPETRILSGLPGEQDLGAVMINIYANDGLPGRQGSDSFTLMVEAGNHVPVLATVLADQVAVEDAAFSYQVPADAFVDADAGDSLQFSARLADGSVLPAWLQFDAETRTFSGMPLNQDVGALEVEVRADDGRGGVVSDVFLLNVENTNDAPTVATLLASQAVQAGAAYSYAIPNNTFIDVDVGDQLSLSATLENGDPLPAWLTFDAVTGIFSGAPGNQEVGATVVKLTALDNAGAAASTTLTINVEGTAGEVISGTQMNDTLYGTSSNDTIIGGSGSDTLYGGDGDDTFLVYGTDSSSDVFNGGAGYDRVLGGQGDDTIRVSNFSGDNTVELIDGGAGINVIEGHSSVNTIDLSGTTLLNISHVDAGGGNDTVIGTSSNDTIIGGSGSDTLYGGDGDDVLNGGTGNDNLRGDHGGDVYLFGRGGGQDIVYDYDDNDVLSNGAIKDRLQFDAGIAADQLWFSRSANSLKVAVIGASDSVTIDNWFAGSNYQLEEFHLAGGSTLLQNQVQQLVDAMAAFAPPASGQLTLPSDLQDALAPVIASSWQTAAA